MGDTIKAALQQAREALERGRKFIAHDVWYIGRPGEDPTHGFVIKQVRVAILLAQGLVRDTLLLRAAALTFATTLFIVPFLALNLFVIQWFDVGEWVYARFQTPVAQTSGGSVPGGQAEEAPGAVEQTTDSGYNKALEERLIEDLISRFEPMLGDQSESGRQDLVRLMTSLAKDGADKISALANEGAKSKAAVLITVALLIITTVFGLMGNIEKSFNHIWGTRMTRSWLRRLRNYLMVTVLLPVCAAAALGITAMLESSHIAELLGPLAWTLKGGQLGVIWLVFYGLYQFVPNTRVNIMCAMLSALFTGLLWYAVSAYYIQSQVGLARYNAVFSGFAQFPMLLMYVYVSWIIVLFGAELAFAYQHEKTFSLERWADNASYAYRETIGLRAMLRLADKFEDGEPGMTIDELSTEWRAPVRILNESMESLEEAGYVRRCATQPATFVPGRPLDKITIGDIVRVLRAAGTDPMDLAKDPAFEPLVDRLDSSATPFHAKTLRAVLEQEDWAHGFPDALPDNIVSVQTGR